MNDAKQIFREEIESCRKVLNGETVNGVKLGDCGIDAEWITSRIEACEWILANR